MLIFISKNWGIDLPLDGCKPLSNLVELIEKDLDFEELEDSKVHLNMMKLWTYKMLEDFSLKIFKIYANFLFQKTKLQL
jgi:hypothetical protein